jgi:hypothetical protein
MRARRSGDPFRELDVDDIVSELFLRCAALGAARSPRESAIAEIVTSYGFEIGESIGDVGRIVVLVALYEEGGEALLRKVIELAAGLDDGE